MKKRKTSSKSHGGTTCQILGLLPYGYVNKDLEKNFQNKEDGFVLQLDDTMDIEQVTILSNLVEKYGELDQIDITDKKTEFKSFINGCKYGDNFHKFFEKVAYEESITIQMRYNYWKKIRKK